VQSLNARDRRPAEGGERTADIELLPLPDWMECLGEVSAADIRDYARANVEHATAPLQAEIEKLREALEEIRSRSEMNWTMRLDPFARLDELGNIHQIADAALEQENKA